MCDVETKTIINAHEDTLTTNIREPWRLGERIGLKINQDGQSPEFVGC